MLALTIIQILQVLLDLVWWIIIVQSILSLLIAFNVDQHAQRFRPLAVVRRCERMTEPLYRPIRRILPDFGALDLSPTGRAADRYIAILATSSCRNIARSASSAAP